MRLSSQLIIITPTVLCLSAFHSVEAHSEIGRPATFKDVDPTDWLHECATEFKKNALPNTNYVALSNYLLIEKPSGLCADFLGCAFSRCNITIEGILQLFAYPNLENIEYKDVEHKFGPLNLPDYVSFPESVKDVKDAISYASYACKGVSIKNGGHSYSGASTQAESVQLNLRKFPKYSAKSIVECTEKSVDNACKLALARGKNATIRVGGGELWNDVYQAVMNYPVKDQPPKYDIVGGGAGTVSSIGGWLQGGGESIGDERMYGFGVDQVLELEMVLADGSHIKFGPTEWQDGNGFLYPRTTKVEGFCNSNISVKESEWNWEKCSTHPFAKLWKAVRGGGGGSYGVVTAAKYQLHKHRPMYYILANKTAGPVIYSKCLPTNTCTEVKKAVAFFFVDLLFNPQAIGVDEETSISTGHPGFNFDIEQFSGLFTRSSPNVLEEAWKRYVKTLDNLEHFQSVLEDLFYSESVGSYANLLLNSNNPYTPAGKIPDNPPPGWGSDTSSCWSVLVPKEILANKDDFLFELLLHIGGSPHVIGGKTSVAHDQTTAINPVQRDAGLQACIYSAELETRARAKFHNYYTTSNPDSSFPGGTEYNHISNVKFGPLKNSHTTACPPEISFESQKRECVSLEESVWGTKILAELESIKKEVDPNNMFKCYRCVGYEHDRKCVKSTSTSAPTSAPTSTSTSFSLSAFTNLVKLSGLWATSMLLFKLV